MTQKNLTVICPNCGKKHKIDDTTKGCGPDTLDGMMAIATVTFSLLTGLGVVVALKCAEWCGAFKSSVELIMAAFVISVAIALPIFAHLMIGYQQKTLNSLGVNLYRISCDCRPENTFTIIRPLVIQEEVVTFKEESEDLN